jgi:NitT/TauT family transport system substrate-binding protein
MLARFGRACLVAPIATALAVALATVAPAQTTPVVRIAATNNDSGAEIYYAQDMGFFEKAGLHVEIVKLASAGLLASSVIAGAVDIAETGVTVIALAHQKGLPLVIIAPAGLESAKNPLTGLVALKTSAYKSGADLNGKTIAVRDINSPAYVGCRAWIDQNGGDSRTVKFVELPDYDDAVAIGAGRVDAAVMAEPDLQNAITGDALHMVAPVYSSIGAEFIAGAYFTTSTYAQEHPDIVRTFAAVMAQTARWANANHPLSAAILTKYSNGHVDPAMPRIAYTDKPTAALFQPIINAAAKYGQLSATFPAAEMFAPGIIK